MSLEEGNEEPRETKKEEKEPSERREQKSPDPSTKSEQKEVQPSEAKKKRELSSSLKTIFRATDDEHAIEQSKSDAVKTGEKDDKNAAPIEEKKAVEPKSDKIDTEPVSSGRREKEENNKNDDKKDSKKKDDKKAVTTPPPPSAACRICLSSSPPLITPCECRAQFAYVHAYCLNQWLETTQVDRCDICRFRFKYRKRRRNMFDWFKEQGKVTEFMEEIRECSFSAFVCMLGIAVASTSESSMQTIAGPLAS